MVGANSGLGFRIWTAKEWSDTGQVLVGMLSISLTALEDFSLEVHSGEVLCIVGASGCGKSTFLNIVAGFLKHAAGEVLLDGKPIHGVEPRCGMIFQDYALFPWMTVLDNIAFSPRGVEKNSPFLDGHKARTIPNLMY